MTKVRVNAGPCGFVTTVTAEKVDRKTVRISLDTGCPAHKRMMEALGDTFGVRETVAARPGCGPFYEYARENHPAHAGCPVFSAIAKCAEAEMGMALKRDVEIRFVEE